MNLMYETRGGCPNCVGSAGEIRIKNFLDKNSIKYVREYTFENVSSLFTKTVEALILLYKSQLMKTVISALYVSPKLILVGADADPLVDGNTSLIVSPFV